MSRLESEIAGIMNASASLKRDLASGNTGPVKNAILCIRDALASGGRVILMGNGGSAADAQHIAAELMGRFRLERRPLPAISLCTDPSVITALGNDYGYDQVFVRQVEALAAPGDVVVGITTSGRSPNVIKALAAARDRGCRTVGMAGKSPGEMESVCDILISVPSDVTARIQEAHTTIGHAICELVERLIVSGETAGE